MKVGADFRLETSVKGAIFDVLARNELLSGISELAGFFKCALPIFVPLHLMLGG